MPKKPAPKAKKRPSRISRDSGTKSAQLGPESTLEGDQRVSQQSITPSETAPAEQFFHIFVKDGKNSKDARNVAALDVLERFALPYRLNRPFRVDGFEFHPSRIMRFKITVSSQRYDPSLLFGKLDVSGIQAFFASAVRAGQEQLDDELDVTERVLEIADQEIRDKGLQPERSDIFDRLVQEDKIFLIMSFSPELGDNYDAIKDACKDWKLKLVRVDKEMRSTSIIDRIQIHLKESNYVIADLTGARPNVYYEIGYFDAVCEARRVDGGGRLLFVAKDVSEAHFDLRHRGIVPYKDPYDLMQKVKKWLTEVVGPPSSA